jgi:D-serine deaminase-like pyridoxal phosphate-dependent protein
MVGYLLLVLITLSVVSYFFGRRRAIGILALRSGSGQTLPDLPMGTRLRILPNHACATGAQHLAYQVISGGGPRIEAQWPRMRGW